LVSEKERKVYLACGNGRSIEESYYYVEPWLTSRGFTVEVLNEFNLEESAKNLTPQDQIILLGTSSLSQTASLYLQNAISRGTKAFIATSPFNISIEDEWKVTESTNDSFIPFLNNLGFAFEKTLVQDISCYPLSMESGEGSNAQYATVNYPLWPVIQSQKEAKQGITVFWPSPIKVYNDLQPLIFTTNMAWLQKAAPSDDGSLFLTNPFLLPKSAKESGSTNGQYILAARNKNISLISDQFFLASLMTGFISGDSSGDFRNFDYLAKELLILRGESELASLMEKSAPLTSLYKIIDQKEFEVQKTKTLFWNFIFLPLCFILFFILVQIKRKRFNNTWGQN
ncbi:MAG: hypothetical protein K5873_02335, partial [Treponema sp.]|nr:hypothetical protein [Treponema sp.]